MVFGLTSDDNNNGPVAVAVKPKKNDQAADAQAALDELKAKEKSDSEDCAFC